MSHGVLLADEDVAEDQLLVLPHGRYVGILAGWIHQARGQVERSPGRNVYQVDGAALGQRRHGPVEVLVISQLPGRAFLLGADAAACRGHVDRDFARLQVRRAQGRMLGPGDRPIDGNRAREFAGDVDDVLALGHFHGAGEGLLRERQRQLQGEGAHRAGLAPGDHLGGGAAGFAVERHARGALFRRGRPETVEREKMAQRHGQRAQGLRIADEELREGAAGSGDSQLELVVGQNGRGRLGREHCARQAHRDHRFCSHDRNHF